MNRSNCTVEVGSAMCWAYAAAFRRNRLHGCANRQHGVASHHGDGLPYTHAEVATLSL